MKVRAWMKNRTLLVALATVVAVLSAVAFATAAPGVLKGLTVTSPATDDSTAPAVDDDPVIGDISETVGLDDSSDDSAEDVPGAPATDDSDDYDDVEEADEAPEVDDDADDVDDADDDADDMDEVPAS